MPGIQDSQIFLRSWVHQENRIITYRLMSRARNIHVDQAKREMQAYYEANQDNTGATFVIRGRLAPRSKRKQIDDEEIGDGDETMVGASQDESQSTQAKHDRVASHVPSEVITLIDGAKLESAKSAFSIILSVQIYSLQPGAIKVASTSAGIVSTHADLHTNPDYAKTWEKADRGTKLGAFRNSQVQDLLSGNVKEKLLGTAKDARPVAGSSTEVAAKQAKSSAVAGKAANTSVSESVPTKSDSTSSKASVPTKAAKKGALEFSKPTAKAAPPVAEKKKEPAKKKEKEKKKKTGNAALMSSSEGGEEEEEDDEEEPDADEAGPIGYDSDEEMADASAPARGKRGDAADLPSSKKTAAQREKDRKALMALADSSAEEEEEEKEPKQQTKKKKPDVKTKAKPSTEMMKGTETGASDRKGDTAGRKKVRKQKKVIKKVKTKVKGYTVMRDEEGYESYSSFLSDSDDDPVEVKAPVAAAKAFKKTSPPPAKPVAAAAPSKPAASAKPAPPAPVSKPPPKAAPAASRPNSSTVSKSSSSSGPQRSNSGGGPSKPAAKGQQTLAGFFKKK